MQNATKNLQISREDTACTCSVYIAENNEDANIFLVVIIKIHSAVDIIESLMPQTFRMPLRKVSF
jgi:hypothetical protein